MTFPRFTFLALLLLLPCRAIAAPADEASAVVNRWVSAYSANDATAVLSLYTPDAILFGTSSPALLQGTEAIRGYFARLPNSGNSVALGDRRVLELGPDAVLVIGYYDFTLVLNGQRVPTPARFSMLLVRRNGVW